MAKVKKSKNSDIEKLRMILDSPSDPKIKKILDKHEKNLSSIRQRLSHEAPKTKQDFTSSKIFKKYGSDNLEPTYTVHEKEEVKPISPDIEPPERKIEESDETKKEEETVEDDLQELFENEELFEVEKIIVTDHEFLEVKPKEIDETSKKDEDVLFAQIQSDAESQKEELIPEWEPVDSKDEPVITEFTEIKPLEKNEETKKSDDKIDESKIETEFKEVKINEEKEEPKDSIEDIKQDSVLPEFTEIKSDENEQETKKSDDKIDESKIETEFKEVKKEIKDDSELIIADTKKETVMPEFTEINTDDKKDENEELDDKKYKIMPSLDKETDDTLECVESGKEIQTWEPIKLDDEKEIKKEPPEIIEQKPLSEKIEEKIPKKSRFPKLLIGKTKSGDEKDRQERKKERKAQKLKIKEEKREKKNKELEIKKSKDEKNRKLFTLEQEMKLKEKETEKQKKIHTKEEQKHISKLVADNGYQKEVIPKSELKAQKVKLKKEEKEREAKIKEQLKEDKKLAELREKELKKQEKEQKKEEKLKKSELKMPELVSEDKNLSQKEKVGEAEATEWEAYDAEEVIVNDNKDSSKYYTHGDFTLYKKEIKTVTGKVRVVHFFSKKQPDVGEPVELPEGYEVKVNKRTELPYLKKKN